MSENASYLPDSDLLPIDDAVARKQMVAAERKSKLTPIQSIFVNHFFECNMDVGMAASRSGVKLPTARDWIEQAGPVSDLIGSRLAEMAQSSKVTVEAIVDRLWDEGTRMPVDSEDKTVSHAARVAALSHLAKFKGMFDKGARNGSTRVSVNINIDGDVNEINGGDEENGQ